jgi:hypothetical protein
MPMLRRSWIAGAAIAAVVSLAQAGRANAGSRTPLEWIEGGFTFVQHICIPVNLTETLTTQYVGYLGTPDVTYPRVGDVYYGHVVISVPGCGGVAAGVEILPPPNTQFAISTANPVYCWYVPPATTQVPNPPAQQITNGCPQATGTGVYGRSLNPTTQGAWPLATGAILEIQFPLVSSQSMSGIATNSYLQGAVSPLLGVWTGPTVGVFVAPNDLIFKNGFDAGNLNAWTAVTDGGDLWVDGGAAMRGSTYGLAALVDDTNAIYVQDNSPLNQSRYRARFYLNPYTFDPGEGQAHLRTRVFLAFDETPVARVMAIVLRRQAGAYSLMVRVRRDDGTRASTAFYPITNATHSVEVDWQRSTAPGASNGTFRLWIDDVLKQTLSGIDNDQAGVDNVRMGALSVKTGASGILLFDELESRSATAVGP